MSASASFVREREWGGCLPPHESAPTLKLNPAGIFGCDGPGDDGVGYWLETVRLLPTGFLISRTSWELELLSHFLERVCPLALRAPADRVKVTQEGLVSAEGQRLKRHFIFDPYECEDRLTLFGQHQHAAPGKARGSSKRRRSFLELQGFHKVVSFPPTHNRFPSFLPMARTRTSRRLSLTSKNTRSAPTRNSYLARGFGRNTFRLRVSRIGSTPSPTSARSSTARRSRADKSPR